MWYYLLFLSGLAFSNHVIRDCSNVTYFSIYNNQTLDSKFPVFVGRPATITTCVGNTICIDKQNGMKLFSSFPYGGYWNVILRLGSGESVNILDYGGEYASLILELKVNNNLNAGKAMFPDQSPFSIPQRHIRFYGKDVAIRIVQHNGSYGEISLSEYAIMDSVDWQTIIIPIKDFTASSRKLDLQRISSVQILGKELHEDLVELYIRSLVISPPLDCSNNINIRINELGYLKSEEKLFLFTIEKKIASVINDKIITFTVWSSSRNETFPSSNWHTVMSDKLKFKVMTDPRLAEWDLSGDYVYEGNFTDITENGFYTITVDQYQLVSPIFQIGDDVYANVFRDLARYFYFARSGQSIEEPYAEGYSRVAYFQNDIMANYTFKQGARDVYGGLFDAGDAHKDMHAQAICMFFLLEAAENLGLDFKFDLNLPESSTYDMPNDLIYIIKYQLEWMAKMQNSDGSVHYWVTYQKQFKDDRGMITNITSSSAAILVAVFARSSKLLEKIDVVFANDLAERAKLSWEWLEKNPDFLSPSDGNYGYEHSEIAEKSLRVWAAVEMLNLYNLPEFQTYFVQNYHVVLGDSWIDSNFGFGGIIHQLNKIETFGLFTYAKGRSTLADKHIISEIKRNFINQGDYFVHISKRVPYSLAMAAPNHMLWGSNGVLAANSYTLFQIYEWTGQTKYKSAALDNLHWIFGRNPVNTVFVSGNGLHSTNFYSFYYTDWSKQPPGYMTGGINSEIQNDIRASSPWKSYMQYDTAKILEPWIGWNAMAVASLSKTYKIHRPTKNMKSSTGIFISNLLFAKDSQPTTDLEEDLIPQNSSVSSHLIIGYAFVSMIVIILLRKFKTRTVAGTLKLFRLSVAT